MNQTQCLKIYRREERALTQKARKKEKRSGSPQRPVMVMDGRGRKRERVRVRVGGGGRVRKRGGDIRFGGLIMSFALQTRIFFSPSW